MYPLLHQSWLTTIKIQIEHYIFTADCLPNTLRCWHVKCQGVHLSSHPISLLQRYVWLEKGDPLQKRKQCRTNFRLLGLPRLVPKPQQQAPLQPPFPWLLPQTYTKKHQLYGLRALKHKKQWTENRFGTHVVKPGAGSHQIAQAICFNAPILRYTAVFSKGHMKGFNEREMSNGGEEAGAPAKTLFWWAATMHSLPRHQLSVGSLLLISSIHNKKSYIKQCH